MIIYVENGRGPLQALSPRSNWATGNRLGLVYVLEGRPRGNGLSKKGNWTILSTTEEESDAEKHFLWKS